MIYPVAFGRAQPCIWMSAGLITYKLCDHDFDCERCPLDAALRGQGRIHSQHTLLLSPSEIADDFPDDRLYSTGHSWVQVVGAVGERHLRFGLDAFAAAIIGSCHGVSCSPANGVRAQGEGICEVDLGLGVLILGAPVAVTIVARNGGLERDPSRLITAPYGNGWIAEMLAVDADQLGGLLTAQRARDQTAMDLRRFRRRVALQILVEAESVGPCLADGGELADLRQMLGGHRYLDLLQELVN